VKGLGRPWDMFLYNILTDGSVTELLKWYVNHTENDHYESSPHHLHQK
jgi:hypothetical protein